ncbi:hypothetical protein AAE478_004123 [Parahypoxylon ruwenzoriense]
MSSLPLDPYKILGVSKDAQLPEIRCAHRKLVLKCHPDKIQDPKLKEEKQKEFQQVQQAYELLSNDAERIRYDDKVRFEELRRDRGMTSTSTSSPRTSKRHETRYYDVREAEPRPTTFASSPPLHNVYGHTPPSRSWDDELFRKFEEKPRYARKTASYEYEKPSRREEERRRKQDDDAWARMCEETKEKDRKRETREAERQREREREKEAIRERGREKEKEAAKKEKDRRKEERKEDKKKSEKERRKESEEKHRRHKSPYVEVYPEEREENIYMSSSSRQEKKKPSSSRKYEEAPPPPRETSRPPATDREKKNSDTLESVMRYLSKSGGKTPVLTRAHTFHEEYTFRHVAPIAVPTPPPATTAVFAPPPAAEPRDAPAEEETPKRSSTKARRMSHDTPRSSKEKPSHKKSGSSREAIIMDASPPAARVVPPLSKSAPIPIPTDGGHRVPHLSRSNTEGYPRPPPAPGLERASTWISGSDVGRDRSRTRHARKYDESSEDDRDRRHRRGRRMHSPEAVHTTAKLYAVNGTTTRVIPVQEGYFEELPRSSKKASYPMANSAARRADPRAAYYDDYEEEPRPFANNVKYTETFDSNDIKFSDLPRSSYREEVY